MSSTTGKSALLMMDMQNSIVSRYVQDEAQLLPFQKAVQTAHKYQIPVIYVRVMFREGYPEISMHNKMFGGIAQRGGSAIPEDMVQIHESLKPQPQDIIVNKRRVSAFTGSDLEVILRAQQIDTLILSGIATSGVVLSTLREAADKDFILNVLSDACIDGDDEVHQLLIEKVFPMQAEVLTVDAWAESLSK